MLIAPIVLLGWPTTRIFFVESGVAKVLMDQKEYPAAPDTVKKLHKKQGR